MGSTAIPPPRATCLRPQPEVAFTLNQHNRGLADVPRAPLRDEERSAYEAEIARLHGASHAAERLLALVAFFLALRRDADEGVAAAEKIALEERCTVLNEVLAQLKRYQRDPDIELLPEAARPEPQVHEQAGNLRRAIEEERKRVVVLRAKRHAMKESLHRVGDAISSGEELLAGGQDKFRVRFAWALALDGYTPEVAAMVEDAAIRGDPKLRREDLSLALLSDHPAYARKRWKGRFQRMFRRLDKDMQRRIRAALRPSAESWLRD